VAAHRIILFPDPLLKQPSRPVDRADAAAAQLLTDLTDTLHRFPGVGLAAPQIGVLQRAVVVDITRSTRREKKPPRHHGLIALLNPRLLRREGELVFREGCLSVPDFLGNVRRAAWIEVEGMNARGETVKLDTDGFEAVALQHEMDHLDGVLFLDRVENVKTDLFRRKNYAPRPPASTPAATPEAG